MMTRLLAVLTVAVCAAPVVADIPPPPPPKGKKYVSVNNEVILSRDVSGYVFFVQRVDFVPGRDSKFTRLELTPDKPTVIAAGGRRTFITLFAVPQDTIKDFKTDAELFEALQANKVKSAHRLGFNSTTLVPDTIKGESVKWTITITAITNKGIQTKIEGEGYEPPTGRPKPEPSPDDDDTPGVTAHTPRAGLWVAGLSSALALMLGGLWIAGRTRRKA